MVPGTASAAPLIPVGASVQMDDIVSVHVSAVEMRLNELFESKKAELTKLRTAQNKAVQHRDALLKKEMKASFPLIEEARAALKKLNPKLCIEVTNAGMSDGDLELCCSIREKDAYGGVSFKLTEDPSVPLQNAQDDVDTQTEKVDRATEEMAKLVQARGKLGSVERRARAVVAQQRLSQTAEGRDLLETLKTGDPSLILGLPAGTLDK